MTASRTLYKSQIRLTYREINSETQFPIAGETSSFWPSELWLTKFPAIPSLLYNPEGRHLQPGQAHWTLETAILCQSTLRCWCSSVPASCLRQHKSTETLTKDARVGGDRQRQTKKGEHGRMKCMICSHYSLLIHWQQQKWCKWSSQLGI